MALTPEQVAAWKLDGYVLLKGLFASAEVRAMLAEVEGGERVTGSSRSGHADAGGRLARMAIWSELGEDIWADASTCPRIVNAARILLGEEIAFFHGKVMLKEARTGGQWEWHQDFGYWYDQGFVFPRMLSAFVALDPATRENGCLQVLRGSHHMGRLAHGRVGDQTGADETRITAVEPLFEHVWCEMAPGDALFFHCNLLHASGANESARNRRAFIMCYNALANPQLRERKTFEQRPCPVSADDAILRRAAQTNPVR